MREPLTAKEIVSILHVHFYASSDLIIPRYTPLRWWECDLWRLTKAGLVDEYEIKLSVADFKADALKAETSNFKGWELDPETNRKKAILGDKETKHGLLAGSERGPNRFWFVIPEEVAAKVEIPAFAGLIVVHSWRGVSVRGRAPKRHNRKWDGDRDRLLKTFYHRYWHHEAVSKAKCDVEPIAESRAESQLIE